MNKLSKLESLLNNNLIVIAIYLLGLVVFAIYLFYFRKKKEYKKDDTKKLKQNTKNADFYIENAKNKEIERQHILKSKIAELNSIENKNTAIQKEAEKERLDKISKEKTEKELDDKRVRSERAKLAWQKRKEKEEEDRKRNEQLLRLKKAREKKAELKEQQEKREQETKLKQDRKKRIANEQQDIREKQNRKIEAPTKVENQEFKSKTSILDRIKKIQEEHRLREQSISNNYHVRRNQLLEKKENWQEIEKKLQQERINKFYHFTDKANLQLIKQHKGLYSWDYCIKNNINVPYFGGGELSRSLDLRDNLQNYVRVSFTKQHPMMFVAQKDGRIQNPIILEISIDVAYLKSTKYSDRNATKNSARIGNDLDALNIIRFELVKKNKHFDIENEEERSYFQAELLILEHIPIEFITNINNL